MRTGDTSKKAYSSRNHGFPGAAPCLEAIRKSPTYFDLCFLTYKKESYTVYSEAVGKVGEITGCKTLLKVEICCTSVSTISNKNVNI